MIKPVKPLVDYRCSSSSSSSIEDLFTVDLRASVNESSENSEDEFYRILGYSRNKQKLQNDAKVEVIDSESEAPLPKLIEKLSKRTETSNRKFDPEYDNLPRLCDPHIHVEDDIKLEKFGVVERYLDFMVIIKPLDGVKYLDFDTLLFNEERNEVGAIFEIFGQVKDVRYTIRFNSAEDAKNALKLGDYVYYAPDEEFFTRVVLTNELFKMKISDGNDASDEEFSNDEDEAAYLAKKANHGNNATRRPVKRSYSVHRGKFWRSSRPQQSRFFPPGPFSLGPPQFAEMNLSFDSGRNGGDENGGSGWRGLCRDSSASFQP